MILTEDELADLQAELPTIWNEYIEKLSAYMESTGKKYRSHAATIRCWATDDTQKATSGIKGGGLPDYTCKEGDSL